MFSADEQAIGFVQNHITGEMLVPATVLSTYGSDLDIMIVLPLDTMNRLYETSTYGFLMTWNGMSDIDADLSSIDDIELERAFYQALSASDIVERTQT